MSGNLSELTQWDPSIYKISDGEDVNAAIAQAATQSLANRTQYLLSRVLGASFKKYCDAATTANISLSGLQVIDGFTTVSGSTVLVNKQTNSYENGKYVVSSGAWTRADDANTAANIAGMVTFIRNGTVNKNALYLLDTPDPIVLGTTHLTFKNIFNISISGDAGSVDGFHASQNPIAGQIPVLTSSGDLPFQVAKIAGNTIWTNGLCTKNFYSGWQKLGSGLIIQWGTVGQVNAGAAVGVLFPVVFPTACLCATSGIISSTGCDTPYFTDLCPTGFTCRNNATGNGDGYFVATYMAIGY